MSNVSGGLVGRASNRGTNFWIAVAGIALGAFGLNYLAST